MGGRYRSVSKFVRDATAGSACTPRGVIAYDFSAATPSALLCRANPSNGTATWAPLEAVAATPLIYLIPQSWAKSSTLSANPAPAGGFSALSSITISEGMQFSATGTGPWSIRIKAADGTSANSAVAIAETYCYYQ